MQKYAILIYVSVLNLLWSVVCGFNVIFWLKSLMVFLYYLKLIVVLGFIVIFWFGSLMLKINSPSIEGGEMQLSCKEAQMGKIFL